MCRFLRPTFVISQGLPENNRVSGSLHHSYHATSARSPICRSSETHIKLNGVRSKDASGAANILHANKLLAVTNWSR